MAKYNVGDIVKILAGSKAGKVGRVESSAPGPQGGEMYHIRLDDGILTDAAERNITLANTRASNSVRSRNAVVAKAINACARNGGIDDFNVGDRVMVRSVVGFTPTDPKPGTVTAIYKSDNRIAVKKDDGGRGLFDASMVTKNACGTARNAWGDETQVNGLITKMLGLINKIKPIAQQLYDTAFDLDDAGSVWLGQNNGSKNAQKVKIAVERANKVMKRLSNFTSGLD